MNKESKLDPTITNEELLEAISYSSEHSLKQYKALINSPRFSTEEIIDYTADFLYLEYMDKLRSLIHILKDDARIGPELQHAILDGYIKMIKSRQNSVIQEQQDAIDKLEKQLLNETEIH